MASGVVSPHEQGVPVTSAQEAGGGQRADLLERLQCVCGGDTAVPGQRRAVASPGPVPRSERRPYGRRSLFPWASGSQQG